MRYDERAGRAASPKPGDGPSADFSVDRERLRRLADSWQHLAALADDLRRDVADVCDTRTLSDAVLTHPPLGAALCGDADEVARLGATLVAELAAESRALRRAWQVYDETEERIRDRILALVAL